MKLLVTVASKHGSTKEIGKVVAEELRAAGMEVDELAPEDVHSLCDYDGVVMGSAVYLARWMDSARDFLRTYNSELRRLPLWAFSVGMSGVPHGNVQDPSRVGPAVLLAVEPRKHITFPGCLDPSQLNLRERTVARLGGAVEGDYRNMDEVRAWTKDIIKDIEAGI